MSSSCFSLHEVPLFCFFFFFFPNTSSPQVRRPRAMGQHGPVSSFAHEGTEAQRREGMSPWTHIWWGTDSGRPSLLKPSISSMHRASPRSCCFSQKVAEFFSLVVAVWLLGKMVNLSEPHFSHWTLNTTILFIQRLVMKIHLKEFAINSIYRCFHQGLWLPDYFLAQVSPHPGFWYEDGKPCEVAELLMTPHPCSPTSSLVRTVIKPLFPPAKQSWSF